MPLIMALTESSMGVCFFHGRNDGKTDVQVHWPLCDQIGRTPQESPTGKLECFPFTISRTRLHEMELIFPRVRNGACFLEHPVFLPGIFLGY